MAKVPFNVSEFDLNHVLNQVGETVESLTKQEIEDILFYIIFYKKIKCKSLILKHKMLINQKNIKSSHS